MRNDVYALHRIRLANIPEHKRHPMKGVGYKAETLLKSLTPEQFSQKTLFLMKTILLIMLFDSRLAIKLTFHDIMSLEM